MLVGGRHFFADADPEKLGHKTLAVNLSDMAAMGATPRWALLAGALPDSDAAWLAAFARGFYALADAHGVELVGGDTTRGPLNLCVTIMGEVPAGQALLRSGARRGRRRLRVGHARRCGARPGGDDGPHGARPPTRWRRRGRGSKGRCRESRSASRCAASRPPRSTSPTGSSAISSHILERSACRRGGGARRPFRARPRSAAHACRRRSARSRSSACSPAATTTSCASPRPARPPGTSPPSRRARDVPLTRIGAITAGSGLVVRDERGAPLAALPRAYDHFA